MADRAANGAQESPESRLLGAGFGRRLEWWVPLGEDRALSLNDATPRDYDAIRAQARDDMLALLRGADEQAGHR